MTMWKHYCKPNRGWLLVGEGEPCSWCDEKEETQEAKEDEAGD